MTSTWVTMWSAALPAGGAAPAGLPATQVKVRSSNGAARPRSSASRSALACADATYASAAFWSRHKETSSKWVARSISPQASKARLPSSLRPSARAFCTAVAALLVAPAVTATYWTRNTGASSARAGAAANASGTSINRIRTAARMVSPLRLALGGRWCSDPSRIMSALSQPERDFLARQRVGHLATADRSAVPHVVPVCYAVADDTLYITIDQKPKRHAAAEGASAKKDPR